MSFSVNLKLLLIMFNILQFMRYFLFRGFNLILLFFLFANACTPDASASKEKISSYTTNLKKEKIQFFYKNKEGKLYRSFRAIRKELSERNKELLFAMNGGMFHSSFIPVGLYIEEGEEQYPLITKSSGSGNFSMKPNGVFFVTNKNKLSISTTSNFRANKNIKYATQSGPMLVVSGNINSKFKKGSIYKKIRNGVGILPNGEAILAISNESVDLYEFAQFFQKKGCKSALYLDGVISKAYSPKDGKYNEGGNFGVIISVMKK